MRLRKKKMYIKNGIVYDPSIDYDPFDDDSRENKAVYRKGKTKRKRYFGI